MISIPPIGLKNTDRHCIIDGVADGYESFLLDRISREIAPSSPVLFVANDDRRLKLIAERLSFVAPDLPVLIFPSWDCLPYDRLSPSPTILARRLDALASMIALRSCPHRALIMTGVNALLQRLPPAHSVSASRLELKPGNVLNMNKLIEWLEISGFFRVTTVRDVGEYAVRGGIIDLFVPGISEAVRLDFFGDTLESIRSFDIFSQRTIANRKALTLQPMSEIILTPQTISGFRRSYAEMFGTPSLGDVFYTSISNRQRFAGMEHWLPFFHEGLETLFDYVPDAPVVFDHLTHEALGERHKTILDHYAARREGLEEKHNRKESFIYYPVLTETLYQSPDEVEQALASSLFVEFTPFETPSSSLKIFHAKTRIGRSFASERAEPSTNVFHSVVKHIQDSSRKRRILLAGWSRGSLDRLAHTLEDHGLANAEPAENFLEIHGFSSEVVALVRFPLETGFESDQFIVVAEQDILGDRLIHTSNKKRKSDANAIAEAISLSAGDIVVHTDHGVGRFVGLRSVRVDSSLHDCLEILYAEGDKLLLPVENIELLSRYGSNASGLVLDRLGGAAWQAKKAKLKRHLLEMAGQLIEIAAERQMISSPGILPPQDEAYAQFIKDFPYQETEDQQNAIDAVFEDLSAGKPMDRLICGDVGFGKTEIALRAAFLAVMHGGQVAVIVPTTLLSRQHFKVFSERFKKFPVNVGQISRLVPAAQVRAIKKGLVDGSVDIVVGSHALLGSSSSFKNLSLLVIDEEQHFGVKQKERLKEMKRNVHVLTLSATPIPRTLQLALSGICDLSLIKTPPVDRMAVRTFVSPFDPLLIRETLLREKYRGGQSFYVAPRISDLSFLSDFLRENVPEVKAVVAHGKMTPSEVEKAMSAFYDREYDVLLSTSIVESGLDIPSANTMIVYRADMFGLGQLYQLRGRVGRSKVRAYALFLLAAQGNPTDSSLQRLKILQSLDMLGAGFQLASHDMDMRGGGNLLGEEQSGHVREVGYELYQQMLEEAVVEMKTSGSVLDKDWSPQITVGVSVMIPENYVPDLELRLALYRRVGNLESLSEIQAFAAELTDRFGSLPSEVEHLLEIVFLKLLCRRACVERLDTGPKGAVIHFRGEKFPNSIGLVDYITRKDSQVKMRPDQALLFIRDWSAPEKRLSGARQIIQQLADLAESPLPPS